MPGRDRVPSFQLASGTTAERDNSYSLTTVGNIFYNTDTSNVEIRHEDPTNSLDWRDLMVNNKDHIGLSGEIIEIGGLIQMSNAPVAVAGRNNGAVSSGIFIPNDVLINQNSFLNSDTGKFTVPTGYAGYYLFTYTGLGGQGQKYPNTRWWINGLRKSWGAAHVNSGGTSTSHWGLSCQVIFDLAEGDYVELRREQGSLYGNNTAHSTIIALYLFSK